MDSTHRQPRVLWSFWLACGLAATGAIAPFLLAAGSGGSALAVAIPFAVAAVAMAVNALAYPSGKLLATVLYAVAWIAIVYGILRMLAAPLQTLVVGGCTVTESGCGPGFGSPFNTSTSVAIGIGIIAGALALQVGLFGLRALYREQRRQPMTATTATAPPTRVIPTRDPAPPAPAVVTAPPESAPAPPPPETESVAAADTPMTASRPPRKPRVKHTSEPPPELAAPEELLELPASSSPDDPEKAP